MELLSGDDGVGFGSYLIIILSSIVMEDNSFITITHIAYVYFTIINNIF